MICNLSDLKTACRPGTCLLGVDPGSVVIGIAISDPLWCVASPLIGIPREKFAKVAAQFATIIKERNVGGLIVGLPKNMDGSEGPSAQAARTLVSNLKRTGSLPDPDMPVVFWDERLSTAAVTRFMISNDLSRKRRDATIDKTAAAYILQGALDGINSLPKKPPSLPSRG